MKRLDLFFTALLVPLDYLALLLAATAAYSLRYSEYFMGIRAVTFDLSYTEYMQNILWLGFIWLAIFALAGLYSTHPPRLARELLRIFYATSVAAAALLAIAFFSRELFDSRFIFLAGWSFATLFAISSHTFVRITQRLLRRIGIGVSNVIVIGKNEQSDTLTSFFNQFPRFGYRVVHTVEQVTADSLKKILQIRRAHEANTLLLTDTTLDHDQIEMLYTFAQNEHFTFLHTASLFPSASLRPHIHVFAGLPIIEVPQTPLNGWGAIYKRAFDIVISLALIVITLPVQLLAMIAILLDSRGGIFFSHLPDGAKTMRIGRAGQPFHYIKFRSMYANRHFERYDELSHLNTREGALVKLKNDPRITPVGRFLRRFSIDELPELWLVLLGHMSLVGPRPHLPEEVERYEPYQRRVLTIKPGITGLAQISGRATLSFNEEVGLDLHYVEHWTPFLDLIILAKTPFAVLFSKADI